MAADFDPSQTTKLRVKVGSWLIDLQSKSMLVLIGVAVVVLLVWIALSQQVLINNMQTAQAIAQSVARDQVRALREIACYVSNADRQSCGLIERVQ